jgi:hypothetical protein
MTISYETINRKASRSKPVAPTPKLRADAAMHEAIANFKSLAQGAGMIGFFLIMMSSKTLSGVEPWAVPFILGISATSIPLTFAAYNFQTAGKDQQHSSGIDDDVRYPSLLVWVRWLVFGVSSVVAFGCLVGHKSLNLHISDAAVVFSLIMIMEQFVQMWIDVLRGIKLLRYAQKQLAAAH